MKKRQNKKIVPHQKRRKHVEAVSQKQLENKPNPLLHGRTALHRPVVSHTEVGSQQNDPPQPGVNLYPKRT